MSVRDLTGSRLVLQEKPWRFAAEHGAAIDRHWAAAVARNPKLFNGNVFIVDRWSFHEQELCGTVVPAKFAEYLYWRDTETGGDGYNEAFASAVVVSSDRGVLLAQSVGGTLNAGRYGVPGGLLDERDVGANGCLDLAGAAARELSEETGLDSGEFERQPGFLLAHIVPFLAVASVYRSNLPGAELVDRVAAHLARQEHAELTAPRIVYRASALDRLSLTPFSRLLSGHVLGM